MRVAAEEPNPVQVALNNSKKLQPEAAEALKKEAQLAWKSKNSSRSSFRNKLRKKPKKSWKKRVSLLRKSPEKVVEAAKKINHAGCMIKNKITTLQKIRIIVSLNNKIWIPVKAGIH